MGTKTRQLKIAETCKNHLRQHHPAQLELVNEFISEIEGPTENHAAWARFTDLKRSQTEMLSRVDEAFDEWLG